MLLKHTAVIVGKNEFGNIDRQPKSNPCLDLFLIVYAAQTLIN